MRHKPFALMILVAGACLTTARAQELDLAACLEAAINSSKLLAAAGLDAREASLKREEAFFRQFPGATLSAGYTRLSELSGGSFEVPLPANRMSVHLPDPLTDMIGFRLDVQFPIFSGFRLRENARMAGLQAGIKGFDVLSLRGQLVFEVRRAYWEAVRNELAIVSIRKNQDLVAAHLADIRNLLGSGLATRGDVLLAEMQRDQTELALLDAETAREAARLVLANLIGAHDHAGLRLTEKPMPAEMAANLALPAEDERRLMERALAGRPELQAAALQAGLAESAAVAARAELWPSLVVSGNYNLARPNTRLFPQTETFSGTWEAGVMARIDLGGLPANINKGEAARAAGLRAAVSRERAVEQVSLEIRQKLLAFKRARSGTALALRMVEQSGESLRVIQEKLANGLVRRFDVLEAELALIRTELLVSSKVLDLEIARADLERAIGHE